jgi:site-specific DNA recombinase
VLKKGAHACPHGKVAADDVEQQVVERFRQIGRDPVLVTEVVLKARAQLVERRSALKAERRHLTRDLGRKKVVMKRMVRAGCKGGDIAAGVDEVQADIQAAESRLAGVDQDVATVGRLRVDEGDLARALEAFGPVWKSLWPAERSRILNLLAERIDYDGKEKRLEFRFRADGIGALATSGAA